MKNIIYALLLLFFSPSFAKHSISISGQIKNSGDKLFLTGIMFNKTIKLNIDGSFKETFDIEYEGLYYLKTKTVEINLYLNKNTQLNIVANTDDFYKSIQLKGIGAIENNYLINKREINYKLSKNLADILKSDLKKEEKQKKINESLDVLNKDLSLLLNNTKDLDSIFTHLEMNNLEYEKNLYKYNYTKIYKNISKFSTAKNTIQDSTSVIKKNFEKFNLKIDFNNESDFLFSNSYQKMALDSLKRIVSKANTNNDRYLAKYYIPEIKKINSIYIQNYFLKTLENDINADNPDLDSTFNELMELSNDSKFKKNILNKYLKTIELTPGKPSPSFEYENFNGGKTSLESLKGKYLYINIWTSWCGPCLNETDNFQNLVKTYKNKNIEFVSISIDKKREYFDWRKLVVQKNY